MRKEAYEKFHEILGLGRYLFYLGVPIVGFLFHDKIQQIPNAWYTQIPTAVLAVLGIYTLANFALCWFAWAFSDKKDGFDSKYLNLLPSSAGMLILAWVLGYGMITTHDTELKEEAKEEIYAQVRKDNDRAWKQIHERLNGIESDRAWGGSYQVEVPRGWKSFNHQVDSDGRITYWTQRLQETELPETIVYRSGPLGNLDRVVVFKETQ